MDSVDTPHRSGATPTPKQLRNIAWTLDNLDRIASAVYEPVAQLDEINAEYVDVTVRLTRDEGVVTPEDARALLAWLGGTEMQDDLRAWADAIEVEGGR